MLFSSLLLSVAVHGCSDDVQVGRGINPNVLVTSSLARDNMAPCGNEARCQGGVWPEERGWVVHSTDECKQLCLDLSGCTAWITNLPINDPVWRPVSHCWLYDGPEDPDTYIYETGKTDMGVICPQCVDTPGFTVPWLFGSELTCADLDNVICHEGNYLSGMSMHAAAFNHPEDHCCACGKNRRRIDGTLEVEEVELTNIAPNSNAFSDFETMAHQSLHRVTETLLNKLNLGPGSLDLSRAGGAWAAPSSGKAIIDRLQGDAQIAKSMPLPENRRDVVAWSRSLKTTRTNLNKLNKKLALAKRLSARSTPANSNSARSPLANSLAGQ